MLLGTQQVSAAGHLVIGGCDTVELAQQYGTPLYVMDEACIRENCRAYRRAFESRHPQTEICYAGKAFLTMALCRIVDQEGLGLDVASAGEFYTALQAGFPPGRVYLHGNFKSPMEMGMALDHGVGRIVVDSVEELELIDSLAQAKGTTANILLRVTPAVDPHTHKFIQTGKIDSKFGLGIDTGQALAGVRHALNCQSIKLCGLHCHVGSQLLDLEAFDLAAEMMPQFIKTVDQETGVTIEELNVGGGLGIRYLEEHQPPSVENLAETVLTKLKRGLSASGLPMPKIMLEPGRSIVGEAGTTLYTIGPIKDIPHVRKYVSVDGGLSDNPRPALYDARYSALIANRATEPPNEVVTVAGKHCETDNLIMDIALASPRPGDTLAVQSTGAYNYAMSSNYNRFTRPAVVLVNEGESEVIVRRETLEDLVAHDVLPERLRC
ncbi:MAG: diaminopimelate decarboxylase [Armatimonadetes bacterium]|nr:diaminopimelate decarboxylase [Armatimonadota bacterium]